ncbi:ankyrin repeat and SOCS box protein 18 [Trichechus manatus latirostris]|uniref:Ankyrin repeat and SOCS box protein 18 n=1 Tax=Trichechus manatus latirostris TaxID=127582 RepID=A0A2Y9G048_TRIMA|nr:ankyrin repeat and SOCS box protein 18 [Trichechus manatus latirostris]
MESQPEPVTGKLQIFQTTDKELLVRAGSPVREYHSALVTGDLDRLKPLMDQFFQDADLVFEIHTDEMEWQVKSLTAFGFSASACSGQARKAGAGEERLSLEGIRSKALMCSCVRSPVTTSQRGRTRSLLSLLSLPVPNGVQASPPKGRSGNSTNKASGFAAAAASTCPSASTHPRTQPGCSSHLSSGVSLQPICHHVYSKEARCAQALLEHGASVHLADGAGRDTPLHVAAQCGLDEHARLYLSRGARVDARAAACAPEPALPQRTVQALLNQGSPSVWPDALPKVLKTCASAPAVIEVLFNSYPQLRVSESWREVIPEEVLEIHQPFYQSLFALAGAPRCLQHLCRCAIRKLFGKKCFHLIPLLPLPKSLQNYLLLEPEGVLR